jgi:hypothetical protein
MHFKCPLCSSLDSDHYSYQSKFDRNFYKCSVCDLVFVDRSELLDHSTEKSRYDNHQNNILSEGYEKFLRRLITPLSHLKELKSYGLDYGQGPYPMLIELMNKDGFENVDGYDPFYSDSQDVFTKKYDFITCCEVLEHMTDVSFELERIQSLLKKNALFIISTGIRTENIDFNNWYYIRDDTHINFLSINTLDWIAQKYNLNLVRTEKDLIIYSKK